MAVLKSHHPKIHETMKEVPAPAKAPTCDPSNIPSISVKNDNGSLSELPYAVTLNQEAEHILAKVSEDSSGMACLLGLGLGFGAQELIKKRPGLRHLVIFEQNPVIFAHALRMIDLTQLLSDSRVILSVTEHPDVPKILLPAIRALMLEDIYIMRHPLARNFQQKEYQDTYDQIYYYANRTNIGGTTTLKVGNAFFTNRFKNLTSIHHNHLLENLGGVFRNKPAILVAAGPSLDKNIHLLKKTKGKAVIIAADTTLPALLAHGITPDFLTTLDAHDFIYEKVASVAPIAGNSISIISSTQCSVKIPKFFPNKTIFWSFTAHPVEAWFNQLLGGSIVTGGAATVAHLSLLSALIMECSPIIFIGQDLAYSESSSHAQHTVMPHTDSMKKRLSTQSEDIVQTKGNYVPLVSTCRSFWDMRKHFEKMIKGHPDTLFINATAGGALIKGTEIMALDMAIDRYCNTSFTPEQQIDDFKVKHGCINPEALLEKYGEIIQECKIIEGKFKEANKLISTAKKQIKKLKEKISSETTIPEDIRQTLLKIDHINAQVDSHDIWNLLQELTMEGLRDSERLLHTSKQLKNEGKYNKWLLTEMSRVSKVNTVRSEALATFKNLILLTQTNHIEEKKLLKAIEAGENPIQNSSKLISLFLSTGDINLAQQALDAEGDLSQGDTAEYNFIVGCIASHRSDFDRAEEHFNKAISKKSSFDKRIAKFRRGLADDYIEYAEYFREKDSSVYKFMLCKGLRYDKEHSEIIKELSKLRDEDIGGLEKLMAANQPQEMEGSIQFWIKTISENPHTAALFTNEQTAMFFYALGKIQADNENYTDAAHFLEKALTYSTNNPKYHFLLTDIYFKLENFVAGIDHLKIAVAGDRIYATYWEKIGNMLFSANDFESAMNAYENCLMALPEQNHLLKKIGDCYNALGQVEAAKTAYEAYKEKMA